MKILLIAPVYLNLYKIIKDELVAEGHFVAYFPEGMLPWNPYYRYPDPIKRWALRFLFEQRNMGKKYWVDKLNDSLFNQYYDLLFVIQGVTFHPCVTECMRKYNRLLKTVLYIWDSNYSYDFFRNVGYFDKVYSFDFRDVQLFGHAKVGFLPFFWSKDLLKYDKTKNKYDLCSIGTSHHGRFGIFKKVIADAKIKNRSCYIKLIARIPQKLTLKQRFDFFVAQVFQDSDKIEYYDFIKGKQKYDFVDALPYEMEDIARITAETKAVLDTDNPFQCGTTPRLIWALAQNKHVYTTNQQISKLPFYNKEYIHIIDREKPIIDYSLLDKQINSRDSVIYLRIDNWLKFFLE